jgi:hypothetical protein
MRAAFALAFLIATTATAVAADSGPVIVIPGRPGVPVMINGVDASYAVVEGDWGLAKGQRVEPTVYGGRPADYEPHVGHYYPSSGHLPGYGRLEIEPPSNGRPQQAESYHRSWSAQSAPQPAQPAAPFYPPPAGGALQNQQNQQNQQYQAAGPQNLEHPPQNFQYRKPRKRPQ